MNEFKIDSYQLHYSRNENNDSFITKETRSELLSLYKTLEVYKSSYTTVRYALSCLVKYESSYIDEKTYPIYKLLSLFIDIATIHIHQEIIVETVGILILKLLHIQLVPMLLSSPLYLKRIIYILMENNSIQSSSIYSIYIRILNFLLIKPSVIPLYLSIYEEIYDECVTLLQNPIVHKDTLLFCMNIILHLSSQIQKKEILIIILNCVFQHREDQELKSMGLKFVNLFVTESELYSSFNILTQYDLQHLLNWNDLKRTIKLDSKSSVPFSIPSTYFLSKISRDKMKKNSNRVNEYDLNKDSQRKQQLVFCSFILLLNSFEDHDIHITLLRYYLIQWLTYRGVEEGYALGNIIQKCTILQITCSYEVIQYEIDQLFIIIKDVLSVELEIENESYYESVGYTLIYLSYILQNNENILDIYIILLSYLVEYFGGIPTLLIPLIQAYTEVLRNKSISLNCYQKTNNIILSIFSRIMEVDNCAYTLSSLISLCILLDEKDIIDLFVQQHGLQLVRKLFLQCSLTNILRQNYISLSHVTSLLRLCITLCIHSNVRGFIQELTIKEIYHCVNDNRDNQEIIDLFYQLLLILRKYMKINDWNLFINEKHLNSLYDITGQLYSNCDFYKRFEEIRYGYTISDSRDKNLNFYNNKNNQSLDNQYHMMSSKQSYLTPTSQSFQKSNITTKQTLSKYHQYLKYPLSSLLDHKYPLQSNTISDYSPLLFSILKQTYTTNITNETVSVLLENKIPEVIVRILQISPKQDSIYLYQLLFYLIAGYALHPKLCECFNKLNTIQLLYVYLVDDINQLNVDPYIQITNNKDIYNCMIYGSYAIVNLIYHYDLNLSQGNNKKMVQRFTHLLNSCSLKYTSNTIMEIETLILCILSIGINSSSMNDEWKLYFFDYITDDGINDLCTNLCTKKIQKKWIEFLCDLTSIPSISKRLFHSNVFYTLNKIFYNSVQDMNYEILVYLLTIMLNDAPYIKSDEKKEICILDCIYIILSNFKTHRACIIKSLQILCAIYVPSVTKEFLTYDFLSHLFIILNQYSTDSNIITYCLFLLKPYILKNNLVLSQNQFYILNSVLRTQKDHSDIITFVLMLLIKLQETMSSSISILTLEIVDTYLIVFSTHLQLDEIVESILILLRYYFNYFENFRLCKYMWKKIILQLCQDTRCSSKNILSVCSFLNSILNHSNVDLFVDTLNELIALFVRWNKFDDICLSFMILFLHAIQKSNKGQRNLISRSSMRSVVNSTLSSSRSTKECKEICHSIIKLL